jgi:anti-sigma B factor antagonist
VTSEHPNLTVEVSRGPEAHTILLAGEADLVGTPSIEAALRDACASESALVVIDLSKLTFIDSSGLHALMSGYELCRARSQELRIVPGPANVQRLFELTGMNDVLPINRAEPALDSEPPPSES